MATDKQIEAASRALKSRLMKYGRFVALEFPGEVDAAIKAALTAAEQVRASEWNDAVEDAAREAELRVDLMVHQEPGEWQSGYRSGMEGAQQLIAKRIRSLKR